MLKAMVVKHQLGFQETAITPPVHTDQGRSALRRSILRPLPCSILAATGIFGGLAALFVGLLCIILHALIPADVTFSWVGTVLLIIAIPMILVGSVFLDEIEANKC